MGLGQGQGLGVANYSSSRGHHSSNSRGLGPGPTCAQLATLNTLCLLTQEIQSAITAAAELNPAKKTAMGDMLCDSIARYAGLNTSSDTVKVRVWLKQQRQHGNPGSGSSSLRTVQRFQAAAIMLGFGAGTPDV